MTTERNKQLVRELFAKFGAGDVPGVLAMIDANATWRIAGKRELTPSAGVYDKARIGKLFDTMMGALKNGLTMTVHGMHAEGDSVAAEVSSRGEPKNGRIYEQEYHFLIEFRGGKIASVREYLDTHHAFAVWGQR